jgi:hypothetical protein
MRSLGRIGPSAQEALPLLLNDCNLETAPWRFDAAVAAWRVSGDSPEAIATLEQGLHATDLEARQLAVASLREIGAEFPKAVTLLSCGLQDQNLEIRLQVLDSLAALGTNAISALPLIEAITTDRMFRMRNGATQTFQAIQPKALPKRSEQ